MKRLLFISGLLCIVVLFDITCTQQSKSNVNSEKIREYANALYNRELYSQAIKEYQRYLDLYSIDEKSQANINYIIGNIYFERLHDYENALAYYLKVRHIYPESEVMTQVNKQIVACLERLQRSADAKQALDEATSLDAEKQEESRPGDVVARLGDRNITSGDLAFHIKQLPEYLQNQLKERKAKIEFLRQYIATELFYDASKRQGLDKDKDVIEGTFQAKKGLMVQKYLENEIANQMNISKDDVELYYKGHKEKYAEKDDEGKIKRQKLFQEVQEEVAQDLVRERQQKAYEELLDRMVEADDVRIFEDKIK